MWKNILSNLFRRGWRDDFLIKNTEKTVLFGGSMGSLYASYVVIRDPPTENALMICILLPVVGVVTSTALLWSTPYNLVVVPPIFLYFLKRRSSIK